MIVTVLQIKYTNQTYSNRVNVGTNFVHEVCAFFFVKSSRKMLYK